MTGEDAGKIWDEAVQLASQINRAAAIHAPLDAAQALGLAERVIILRRWQQTQQTEPDYPGPNEGG